MTNRTVAKYLAALVIQLGLIGCESAPAPSHPDSAGADAVADATVDAAGETKGQTPDTKVYIDATLFPDLPANSSPTVQWLTPLDGDVLAAGLPVVATLTVGDDHTAPADLGVSATASDGPALAAQSEISDSGLLTVHFPGLAAGKHQLQVTIFDGMGGQVTATRQVTLVAAPVAPSVTIQPAAPVTGQALHAAATQPGTGTLKFQWYRNNLPLPWGTSADVPAGQTQRDDVWRIEVQAHDGPAVSPAAWAQVAIGNAAPGPVALSLSPTQVDVAGSVGCALDGGAADPDNDEITYGYAWSLDGVALGEAATAATLALATLQGGNFAALVPAKVGQTLTCTVTADDGHGGQSQASASAVLQINPACGGDGNPCGPSADCSPTDGAAVTCSCKAGYSGDGADCSDVDECAGPGNPCGLGADCSNTVGGYDCACQVGFAQDATGCVDIDECQTNPCALAADCSNTVGAFTCTCVTGYAGNGFSCSNLDECQDGSATCDPLAQCLDTNGSYLCQCLAGFEGDGLTCSDIDECASVDLSGCATEATCQNLPGWYQCTCNNGYQGSGDVCDDVDECASVDLSGCATVATCQNLPGSHQCACPSGYTGDGIACDDINECVDGSAGCSEFAWCTNLPGTFTCTCATGYAGNGLTCTPE